MVPASGPTNRPRAGRSSRPRAIGNGIPQPAPAAADREVLETPPDEAEHLVPAVLGLTNSGFSSKCRSRRSWYADSRKNQFRSVSHWSGTSDGSGRSCRARLLDVGRVPEALVRAVPALVRPEVDVAVRVGPPDHLLGGPTWSGSVVRMKRSGLIRSASSAALNSSTFSSTNSFGDGPPRRPASRC